MRSSSSYEPVVLILSTALTAVLWVWLWLHVSSKIGYRGLARKLWLVAMCLPPTMPIAMIALLVLPWPIHQELRKLKKAIPEIQSELERLKKRPMN